MAFKNLIFLTSVLRPQVFGLENYSAHFYKAQLPNVASYGKASSSVAAAKSSSSVTSVPHMTHVVPFFKIMPRGDSEIS